MKKPNKQAIIPIILLLLGIVLFVYGADFHRKPVYSEDGTQVMGKAEFGLIKEVTVGGIRRDELGNIRQTYTGKPPESCPT
jgi:hypothetical protein